MEDEKINKKEEENYKQEKLEGDLTFTLWKTSHPPLYVLLKIKNWKMCKTPLRQENFIESLLARNAGADTVS